MNADLFRRLTSLGFAFIYTLLAYVLESQLPDAAMFCFFLVFLLGIWLDAAMTWRESRNRQALIECQQALINLYKERIRILDAKADNADWWKEN